MEAIFALCPCLFLTLVVACCNLCLCVVCSQKIERLKGELHLLNADRKQKNKHTFFVDSKKEGRVKSSAALMMAKDTVAIHAVT